MELKRILAKDSRSAMDIAMARYGKDVLIVSNHAVEGQVELVVALDVEPETAQQPPPVVQPGAFTEAFRAALVPVAEAAPAAPPAAGVLPAAQAPSLPPATPTAAASDARAHEVIDLVRREIAALRQEFQLSRQVQAWQQQTCPVEVAPLVAALHDLGVPAGLRALLVDSVADVRDAQEALRVMRQLVGDALAGLPGAAIERGIHAVCGPSGAGKSSMVARLAGAAAQRLGAERVAVVMFNDPRSGAWSQMQILAAQAGVNCYRAPDEATLRLLLDELGGRQLILIDTAGSDCLAQASRLHALGSGVQVHALVPADVSIGGVRRVLGSEAGWASVMVSKLDECESPWPLLQALCDRRWAVSCTSGSTDVQQPAQGFDPQRLLEPAFERLGSGGMISLPSQATPGPAKAKGRVRVKAEAQAGTPTRTPARTRTTRAGAAA